MNELLQDIYDNEINISINWFWDNGIDVAIGDDINGWEDSGNFDTIKEAMEWLEKTIPVYYPEFRRGKE